MAKLDKLAEQAKPHMRAGEQIEASLMGAYEVKIMGGDSVRNGVLLATNERVVFFAKKLTGFDLESFPYSNISSVEMGKNMMGHHIKLFASGNEISVKWIKKGDIAGFVELVRSRIGRPHTASAQVPNHQGSPMEQLKSLAELRDQGIVTEEEFQAKKVELLSKM